MADDAAEEAFINSMRSQNSGVQGVAGTVSQQQADSDSDDEYDPAEALQADTLTTDAKDITVPSPSVPVMHEALLSKSTPPVTAPSSANNAYQDQVDINTLNESRSMSPDSSVSVKEEAATETETKGLLDAPQTETSISKGEAGTNPLANGDNLDQVSPTAPNIVHDSIPTPNVPLHDDVQNTVSTDFAQNSVASSDHAAVSSLTDSATTAQGNSQVGPKVATRKEQSQDAAASQTVTSPTVALPKTRLPHDRVGILEDRIKEDTRGDLDAWLSLIDEYRKRGKIDEARNVYERFFSVYPWAVSSEFNTPNSVPADLDHLTG